MPAAKVLKVPQTLYRSGTAKVNPENGTVTMSVSSSTPYERFDWWAEDGEQEFWEVLSHDPDGIDMTRLDVGTSLLYNHQRDILIGRQISHRIEGEKLYIEAKISKAPDVESHRIKIEEGILVATSVGYQLLGPGKKIGTKDGKPIYKFRWAPYEQSLVTIEADITVGIGRQREHKPKEAPLEISIIDTINVASSDKLAQTEHAPKHEMKITPLVRQHFLEADNGGNATTGSAPAVDLAKERADAAKAGVDDFRKRVKKIEEWVAALRNPEWRQKCAIVANKHKELEADFQKFWDEAQAQCTTEQSVDTPFPENGGSRFQVVGNRDREQPNRAQQPITSPGDEFTRAQGFVNFVKGGSKGGFRAALQASYLWQRAHGAGMIQRAGFNSADLANINITVSNQLISLGVQRLTIMDLIAPGTMSTEGFLYPVENSFDPFAEAAGMVAERGLKPEWEPDLTTARADAQIVAIMATIPKQFLQDFAAFKSWLDNRLDYLLQIKTEQQMLYGDGIGANLQGITSRPGIQSRAYGTVPSETTPDALFRGNTDIETISYFDPDGFAMHPYDWEQVRLLKDLNGQYIAGGPFYAPYGNGMVVKFNTIWGLPVVVSKSVKLGKPIAGAWKMGAQYFMRQGMEIETTNAHKDYFQRNLIAVLAEQRLALAVYRPIAFLEHTGFPGRS